MGARPEECTGRCARSHLGSGGCSVFFILTPAPSLRHLGVQAAPSASVVLALPALKRAPVQDL